MDKKCNFIKHPSVWIYIVGSAIVLFAIYVAEGTEKHDISDSGLPKSSLTKSDVGLPDSDWRLMCFADTGNHGYSDVIYVRDNELSTFRFFKNVRKYQKHQSVLIRMNNTGDVIHEVHPVEWFSSGFNDLLIVCKNDLGLYSAMILKNENGDFNGDLIDLNIRSRSVPFVFDFQHMFIDDILYLDDKLDKWMLYKKKKEFLPGVSLFGGFGVAQLTDKDSINFIAKTSNSKSKTEFSIFEFQNDKWKLFSKFDAPPNSGEIAIADFDKNGILDIAFPVYTKNSNENYLCYMFNSKNGFQSSIDCLNKNSSIKLVIPNIIKDTKPGVGDITLDGYPSISLGIQNKKDTYTQLILNQQCKNCGIREMIPVLQTDLTLPGIGGFFDIYQDGSVDYITNKGSFISTLAEKSYFLKATSLNGVCLNKCKGRKPSKTEYLSTFYKGATFHIFYTDKQGFKHNLTCAQYSTGGISEQNCLFGLGENVHYIEELTVLSHSKSSYRWILPNSHIFSSTDNHYRVFLHYQIQGFPVLFCFVLILLILGFLILIYSQKENAEDRKEADEMLPMF